MKRELSFTMYRIINSHSNDLARVIHDNILGHLLKVNYFETVDYIKSIENEKEWDAISSHFPYIAFHFQKKEFIDIIKKKNQEFSDNQRPQFILSNIKEAENAIEDVDSNIQPLES